MVVGEASWNIYHGPIICIGVCLKAKYTECKGINFKVPFNSPVIWCRWIVCMCMYVYFNAATLQTGLYCRCFYHNKLVSASFYFFLFYLYLHVIIFTNDFCKADFVLYLWPLLFNSVFQRYIHIQSTYVPLLVIKSYYANLCTILYKSRDFIILKACHFSALKWFACMCFFFKWET